MEIQRPAVTASSFFLLFLVAAAFGVAVVNASHAVYKELQSVPASVVDPKSRTGYHFQPPKHWINDPNGPMYYEGLYHLFYQYNPNGSVWGNIVWAHSVSTDLINWVPLEPAIYPSQPFDAFGCWSGSTTILPDGTPAILYTGIVDAENTQVQNVAFPANLSDPFLREWVKPAYNPVISGSGNVNASAFRDPTTAWLGSDGRFRVVVGSRRGTERGLAILYRSRDFRRWTKAQHPLHSSKSTGMWECPDFFPVAIDGERGVDTSALNAAGGGGVKHVLKVSLDLTRYEYYTVGRYFPEADRYVPDNTSADDHTGLRYDYGNFYASKTFYDPRGGRRVLWGWSNETDTRDDDIAKGWAGVQAIPRSLWLDGAGKQLVQWPVAELETLRRSSVRLHGQTLLGGGHIEVVGIQSAQADVEATFEVAGLEKAEELNPTWSKDPQEVCGIRGAEVSGGVAFGLYVMASGDLEERTAVFFRVFKDKAAGKYVVLMCNDPARSTLNPDIFKPTFAGFVDVDIERTRQISLRTLIDHSVVESFGAGGRMCITTRVYPSKALGSDAHLFVFNNGDTDVKIAGLTAWEMASPTMN